MMRWKNFIWMLLFLVGIIPRVGAQYINSVCAGDTGVVYRIQGSEGSTFKWNVEGGSIVSDYGDSIKVNWGYQSGEHIISVQEFSKYGCPAVPVTARVYVMAPALELGADIEICEGESVDITPEGSYNSYLWHNGSTSESYTASTEGYISLKVSDESGCTNRDSLYLSVHPLPFVDLGPDSSLCGDEQLILDAGMEGIQYAWSTGESESEIVVNAGQQTIWVQVMNEFDCVSYDSVMILPCDIDERFRNMPTAFTPNSDGSNDTWIIPELEEYPEAVIEIYDRWGHLVFESEPGYTTPWEGTSMDGRELPVDSYYFIINLEGEGSEQISGTVTIIK